MILILSSDKLVIMQKDFDKWNEHKKAIDGTNADLYFYERDIWWCSLGVNVGFEQDGKNEYYTRPILVLKKFSKDVFIGIPLSTSNKEGKYYFKFNFQGQKSNALLSQIRLFDTKRLKDKLGRLPHNIFKEIRQKVKDLL